MAILESEFVNYQERLSDLIGPYWGTYGIVYKVTKASMLAEFFFALAMLWWEGLRALKIDISS